MTWAQDILDRDLASEAEALGVSVDVLRAYALKAKSQRKLKPAASRFEKAALRAASKGGARTVSPMDAWDVVESRRVPGMREEVRLALVSNEQLERAYDNLYRVVGDISSEAGELAAARLLNPQRPSRQKEKNMTYDEIKARIRQAGRLIDEGDLAGADKIIRETPGLTRADLDAQLPASDIEKLRKWSRSKKKTSKKTAKRSTAKRRKNTDVDDPRYHLRNVMLDQDLAIRAMDWHGGQASMVYSLASTAYAGKLVSPSMIDAAIAELESDLKDVDAADLRELEGILDELEEVARFPEEHTYEDDDGYATWLMDREQNAGRRPKRTAKKRTSKKRPSKKRVRNARLYEPGRWVQFVFDDAAEDVSYAWGLDLRDVIRTAWGSPELLTDRRRVEDLATDFSVNANRVVRSWVNAMPEWSRDLVASERFESEHDIAYNTWTALDASGGTFRDDMDPKHGASLERALRSDAKLRKAFFDFKHAMTSLASNAAAVVDSSKNKNMNAYPLRKNPTATLSTSEVRRVSKELRGMGAKLPRRGHCVRIAAGVEICRDQRGYYMVGYAAHAWLERTRGGGTARNAGHAPTPKPARKLKNRLMR